MPDHEYSSPGYYFVTIKTAGSKDFFGRYTGKSDVTLTWMGKIAEEIWQRNNDVYENAQNDIYRFMPNHMHAIVLLKYRPGHTDSGHHLSSIIRSFKSCVTKELRMQTGMAKLEVWQRNYHERILRSERSLDSVRDYILYNALAQELQLSGNR